MLINWIVHRIRPLSIGIYARQEHTSRWEQEGPSAFRVANRALEGTNIIRCRCQHFELVCTNESANCTGFTTTSPFSDIEKASVCYLFIQVPL
jgi:hypothetical protein